MGVEAETHRDRSLEPPHRGSDSQKDWLAHQLKRRMQAWWQQYFLHLVLRQRHLPPSKHGRCVPLAAVHEKPLIDERSGRPYLSNSIRSSRYTVYDFLPKQLFFQCTRLANFYLICIGIPQAMPGLSPTGNFTTILPLMVFILLTVAKEGWDDYRRHRLDKAENNTLATVLRDRRHHSSHGESPRFPLPRSLISLMPIAKSASATEAVLEADLEDDETLRWARTRWRDINVGDVVRLKRDDPVPADIVLLHADGENGIAYIETMALDGETNLKSRQTPAALRCCNTLHGIKTCNAEFVVEDPNPDLYQFEGRVTVGREVIPLTLNEVIFRGCIVRNTGTVIGLVINTGEETKIRMNANHHPDAKKPRLEKFSNQIVISLAVYVIILTMGCSIGYWLWQKSTEKRSFYLEHGSMTYKEIIIGFAIEFNNIIPLALYVSLEIVKIGQALMLSGDLDLYDETTDTPMGCNTNTILENLGQVSFVLSDKTGTLTENVMKFQKISVAGLSCFMKKDEGKELQQEAEVIAETVSTNEINEKFNLEVPVRPDQSSLFSQPNDRSLEFPVSDLLEHIHRKPDSSLAKKAEQFIIAMAICNTCLPEVQEGQVEYQASSPDELALVQAARDLGYRLTQRTMESATIFTSDSDGTECPKTYEILDVIEFSSKRKRMSIIVRTPEGSIWLLCKGADSVITPRLKEASIAAETANGLRKSFRQEHERLRKSEQLERSLDLQSRTSLAIRRSMMRQSMEMGRASAHLSPAEGSKYRKPRLEDSWVSNDSAVFARCFRHLHEYATDGLRTLVFAHRVIPPEEYSSWKKLYHDATTSLSHRQERIEDAAEHIEKSLDLLGASAIEDKLQKGVPETIEKLRRANIRIWMLTGDKRETAINIAHSARLCLPSSEIFTLDATKGDLQGQLDAILVDVQADCVHSVVVIDGHTLSVVEEDLGLKSGFYLLMPRIDSVICCRASPAQKAAIVKALRSKVPEGLTLAIGDGANDIAMIQASHVGVGISGKEGLQASRVADYSIAQFRFLAKLLLVHGRWNYVRTANFVLFTFWKEMFFYMMQALYQRYNGYTGTSLYEMWSLTVLNTLFTSLCVIVPGMFEQDLHAETLLAIPELYSFGQKNKGLNIVKFIIWMAVATVEGMIVWFVTWAGYGWKHGAVDQGIFALGDLVFTAAIIWTNWKLFLFQTHHKSRIVIIAFLITVGGWWAWNAFLSGAYAAAATPYAAKYGFLVHFGRDPLWWITLVLELVILMMAQVGYKVLKRCLLSSQVWRRWKTRWGMSHDVGDLEYWQEMEKEPGVLDRLRVLATEGMGAERDH